MDVQLFEEHRPRLRAVAYRMLGSLSEADDAVQEAWLHASRSGSDSADNPGGWLTTIVARVCLDMLRARKSRREEPLSFHLPDPVIGPEDAVLHADAVGMALLVVLDTLGPAERLAYVLHDMFAVPFSEIGTLLGRTSTAARQLASRARRRIRRSAVVPDGDLARQQRVVGAFLAAARDGDLDALLAVLDPSVVVRADRGALGSLLVGGADRVSREALSFASLAAYAEVALVNGAAGIVVFRGGRLSTVMGCTVVDGRIVEIDIIADPGRLAALGRART